MLIIFNQKRSSPLKNLNSFNETTETNILEIYDSEFSSMNVDIRKITNTYKPYRKPFNNTSTLLSNVIDGINNLFKDISLLRACKV